MKYYETYESPSYLYLVMEYCKGQTLENLLADNPEGLPELMVAQIMQQLFMGVNHCHSSSIIHRDLKPDNIMICDNAVKILDFGLSKAVLPDSDSHTPKTLVGTPYYVAPEVFDGDYGKECDYWSLGVILYQLLSGKVPFEGDTIPEIAAKIREGVFSLDEP